MNQEQCKDNHYWLKWGVLNPQPEDQIQPTEPQHPPTGLPTTHKIWQLMTPPPSPPPNSKGQQAVRAKCCPHPTTWPGWVHQPDLAHRRTRHRLCGRQGKNIGHHWPKLSEVISHPGSPNQYSLIKRIFRLFKVSPVGYPNTPLPKSHFRISSA